MNKVNNGKLGGSNFLYRIKLLVKKIWDFYREILCVKGYVRKWGRFPRTFVFDKEKKVVYLNNPKVACSSIKESMVGKQPDIHQLSDNSTKELSTEMEQYYKFTFVRNPYKRLVSCFEDKCVKQQYDDLWYWYFLGTLFHTHDFNQFIRCVCLIPHCLAEPHFAGQYQLIYYKNRKCLVDFVGKVENIKDEYESIRERFDFLPLGHLNRAASLTGKNWMDYYTPFTAWLVYRKYKKDFITFGYEDEYRKLKDYLKTRKS